MAGSILDIPSARSGGHVRSRASGGYLVLPVYKSVGEGEMRYSPGSVSEVSAPLGSPVTDVWCSDEDLRTRIRHVKIGGKNTTDG